MLNQNHSTVFPGGSRKSTAKLRNSQNQAENFDGLPQDCNRFDLLRLVKDIGPAGGFSRSMVQLLEYYLCFTHDTDWETGGRPICYQSVQKTAQHFGVSERSIQKTEKALHAANLITWNDSGNHRRYGQRDKAGRLIYAYGVDLTPLAVSLDALETRAARIKEHNDQWRELKRQVSHWRAKIRGLIEFGEGFQELSQLLEDARRNYAGIAKEIRVNMDMVSLAALLGAHKDLYTLLLAEVDAAEHRRFETAVSASENNEYSRTHEQKFAHKYSTNQPTFSKENSGAAPEKAFDTKGVENSYDKPIDRAAEILQPVNTKALVAENLSTLRPGMVVNIFTDELLAYLPIRAGQSIDFGHIVEAAYSRSPKLGISQDAWAEACAVMGRTGAAVAVTITDAKVKAREVRSPGGYLRAMTIKARNGELNLQGSIFGLLDRKNGKLDA